jgi:hypothetical protein
MRMHGIGPAGAANCLTLLGLMCSLSATSAGVMMVIQAPNIPGLFLECAGVLRSCLLRFRDGLVYGGVWVFIPNSHINAWEV